MKNGLPGVREPREERGHRGLNAALAFVLFLYLAIYGYSVQYSYSGMKDGDSYVHTRMANLLYKEGPARTFPWTQFTHWKDAYNDKDFLFHVLLGLFCLDEEEQVEGGKLFIWLLGTCLFAAFVLILFLQRFRHPALWILLLTISCYPVFWRIMRVRPHVLSMLLVLLVIHALLSERHRLLLILSFLFALSHTSAPLVLVLAGLHLLSTRLVGEKVRLRTLIYPAAGLLAGFVINPYFPNNFYLWYVQGIRVLLNAIGMEQSVPPELLGGEFMSISTRQFLLFFRFLLPVLAIAVLWGYRKLDRIDKKTMTLMLFTLFFLVMGFFSERFLLEYWVFVAVLFCASLFDRITWYPELRGAMKKRPLGGALILFLLIIGIGYFIVARTVATHEKYSKTVTYDIYEKAVTFLRDNADEGEVVFHPDWRDFSSLFHFNPNNRYVVGLDPTYFYFYDKDLFQVWVRIQKAQSKDVYEDISKFGARWAYVEKRGANFLKLVQMMTRHPRIEKRYEDKYGAVFFLQ